MQLTEAGSSLLNTCCPLFRLADYSNLIPTSLAKSFPYGVQMRAIAFLVAASALASDCSVEAAPLGVTTATVPLVGVETCQTDGANYLVRCVIPTRTLTSTPFESAVPVRTVLKRNLIGTCVANKNPRLSLAVAGESPVSYSFFGTPSVTLRKGDRSPITAFTLQDEIPAETFGIRMQGCRVTLDVTFNEADVNSAAEAQTLIASVEADRDQKIQIRDRYLQLVQLSSAVEFLREAGENMTTQLTSTQMQELRTAAINSDEALKNFLTTCASSLSQTDRINLTDLYGHLWVLGEPGKWVNPDGSRKTLADFLGPEAQRILTSIRNATQGALDPAQLQAEASAASLAAERAIARVGIARQQLSAWLS